MAKVEKKQDKSKKEVKNKRHYFKDFKAELKKVVWPTPKQLSTNTIAVIVIVLLIAIIVFALDMGFELINKKNAELQSKLQEKYSTSSEETNTTTDVSEENTSEDTNVEASSEGEIEE